MIAVKTYEVSIGGIAHVLQLSDEDAKRYGAKPVESKKAPAAEKPSASRTRK